MHKLASIVEYPLELRTHRREALVCVWSPHGYSSCNMRLFVCLDALYLVKDVGGLAAEWDEWLGTEVF